MRASASLIQTAHAELVEHCSQEGPEERGAYTSKLIGGKRYWYIQTPSKEGRRQKYVGLETPELLERIAKHRDARQAQKDRRALVALLARTFRVPRPTSETLSILGFLAKAGLFRQGAVLVGPMAYRLYAALLGTRLPETFPQPGDALQIASRGQPSVLGALQPTAKAFRVVSRAEAGTRTTSYLAPDGFRLDLLNPVVREDEPNLLDFLLENPEPTVLLHQDGIPVMVPSPARFAIFQLISPSRSERDLVQAKALVKVLLEQRPNEFGDVWHEANERGWRHALFGVLEELPLRTAP